MVATFCGKESVSRAAIARSMTFLERPGVTTGVLVSARDACEQASAKAESGYEQRGSRSSRWPSSTAARCQPRLTHRFLNSVFGDGKRHEDSSTQVDAAYVVAVDELLRSARGRGIHAVGSRHDAVGSHKFDGTGLRHSIR